MRAAQSAAANDAMAAGLEQAACTAARKRTTAAQGSGMSAKLLASRLLPPLCMLSVLRLLRLHLLLGTQHHRHLPALQQEHTAGRRAGRLNACRKGRRCKRAGAQPAPQQAVLTTASNSGSSAAHTPDSRQAGGRAGRQVGGRVDGRAGKWAGGQAGRQSCV